MNCLSYRSKSIFFNNCNYVKVLSIFLFSFLVFNSFAEDYNKIPLSDGQIWTGYYYCSQGKTNLTLKITKVSQNTIYAYFDFNYSDGKAYGKFLIEGKYYPKDRVLQFVPGKWVLNPFNFMAVGMSGNISNDGKYYEGKITHSSCGQFHLSSDKMESTDNKKSVSKKALHSKEKYLNYDIKGIKLSMNKNEVKRKFPKIKFHERMNYQQKNSVEKYSGGAGTGWGMISDWNVFVKITGEPYGEGAYYIHYKKFFNQKIDAPSFVKNFRGDLISKYGKPVYENVSTDNSYFACWGDHCNKRLAKLRLHDTTRQYWALRKKQISNNQYLIVTFNNSPTLQDVKFTLFDTNPYHLQIKEKNRRKVKKSKIKIDF